MSHRPRRTGHWYLEIFDDDAIVPETSESFEQWDLCRYSSSVDCAAGDSTGEQSEELERGKAVHKRVAPSGARSAAPPRALSSYGRDGIDYVQVTSFEQIDRILGEKGANISGNNRAKLVASLFVLAICSWWRLRKWSHVSFADFFVRSKPSSCHAEGEREAADETEGGCDDGRGCAAVEGSAEKALEGSPCTSSTAVEAQENTSIRQGTIGSPFLSSLARSPRNEDEVSREVKAISCPSAPVHVIEDDLEDEDETITRLLKAGVPCTPQRAIATTAEWSSCVRALTTPSSKADLINSVSLLCEMGMEPEKSRELVAKNLFDNSREERRQLHAEMRDLRRLEVEEWRRAEDFHRKERRHKEKIDAMHGENSLDKKVEEAQKKLRSAALSIFPGVHFCRCICAGISARIFRLLFYPVVLQVLTPEDAGGGSLTQLLCGCSSYQSSNMAESAPLDSSMSSGLSSWLLPDRWIASFLPEAFSSFIPDGGTIMCLLRMSFYWISLSLIHRLIESLLNTFYLNKSMHGWVNVVACFYGVLNLAVPELHQKESIISIVLALSGPIACLNAILSGVLWMLLYSRSWFIRHLLLKTRFAETTDKLKEAQLILFRGIQFGAYLLSTAFAVSGGFLGAE